jgi:hypothetical protein
MLKAFVVGTILAASVWAYAQESPNTELLTTALQQILASRNNLELQLIACRSELEKKEKASGKP